MVEAGSEIRDAVAAELDWDVKIAEHTIDVQVDGRAVILVGTVGSWPERLAAQEAAQRVIGVRDVSNRLEVALALEDRVVDRELARSIRCALDSDVFARKVKIVSSVCDGQVILEGEVSYCALREDVERVVRNIWGVRRVLNQILVKPPVAEAHRVQTAIEAALDRRLECGARTINLDVHDGKVILSGIVHSSAERKAILAVVKGTRGVRSVDDRLALEP